MRILRLSTFLILIVLCLAANGAPPPVAPKELVVLTWADYIDPHVVAQFERSQHAKVKFMYFESDDDRDELLTQGNGIGYDVVLADGISVTSYADAGWLAPIRQASIPNLKHIDPRWRKAFPHAEQYGVPYFWGTIGIAYRRDLAPTAFTSWLELYRPQPALRGKIVMIKHARDVIGMALKALGYSQNSGDPAQLAQARELVLAQKPFVRAYSYVSLGKESALVTGEAWAAMVFSGDSITLRELNPNIAFVAQSLRVEFPAACGVRK
ncbi:MAG: spermidine/putrescine ABC transporter substrate-binding protein [Gammaproteobacteria bacterium]|nr:spermidine/putrescine ABC transporter substrate-binding protein [Gammaproteobacteria bacterium]